jgi:hypothetical protein
MSNFLYKGMRKYIHITDIYNYFFYKKNYQKLNINFKKKIINEPLIVLTKKKNIKNANCVISVTTNKKKNTILLLNSRKKIKGKYNYDENLLFNYFHSTKKKGKCNFETSMSSIEVLISLIKYFHISRIFNAKWVFSKLNLLKKLKEKNNKNFLIVLKKNYINKFTELDIFQDSVLIGKINFSRKLND